MNTEDLNHDFEELFQLDCDGEHDELQVWTPRRPTGDRLLLVTEPAGAVTTWAVSLLDASCDPTHDTVHDGLTESEAKHVAIVALLILTAQAGAVL